jgi:3-methylfumaryl-CoA hydratase
LVVHGPLLALLLLELPRRFSPGAAVASFEYRLQRPCFAGHPVVAGGDPDDAGVRLSAGVPGAEPSITGRVRFTAP